MNHQSLYMNIDENGERQFILESKYSRDKKEAYVGIVIKVDNEGNKYYSHIIFQKENNRKAQGSFENQKTAQKQHSVFLLKNCGEML